MSPETMNAIVAAAQGGPDVLQPGTVARPLPGSGQVLIRVAAAGVNYPDLLQRRGLYPVPPDASPLLGLEVAGEIAGVGDDVSGFSIGDRVMALCNGGGYAEFVAVPAGQVLPLPEGWSLAAAAAMPETLFTIEQTLVLRAGLSSDMSVLVHGAAGGIGGTAIQIARILGARPIAVVSDDVKAWYAGTLGATDTIVHTRDDFVVRARELTDGHGVDRIVSIAGGDILNRNLEALATGGTIVQLAGLSGNMAPLDIGLLLRRNATLIGSVLRPQPAATKAEIARGLLRDVWPAMTDGRMRRPRIRTVPLAEAARAHAAMEQRDSYGKFVLLTEWGASMVNDNSVASLP